LAKLTQPAGCLLAVSSTGNQLQQNSALETTNWTSVATSPVQAGDKWQVPVSPPVGNKFYRLKK
jgi:hypothetical protein